MIKHWTITIVDIFSNHGNTSILIATIIEKILSNKSDHNSGFVTAGKVIENARNQ